MNVIEWLNELEKKADAATPGPWEDFSNHPDHIAGSVCKGERGIKHICLASFYESTDERQTITHKECLANASFIAAANPETVKMLVQTIKHLILAAGDQCYACAVPNSDSQDLCQHTCHIGLTLIECGCSIPRNPNQDVWGE